MKFNTRFNPYAVPGIKATGGVVQQHFKDECDLNLLLKRYHLGVPPPSTPARYEDLTQQPKDLMEAFDMAASAQDWFEGLPASVRDSVGNDVVQALRIVNTNPQLAVQLHLLEAPAKPVSPAEEKPGVAVTPPAAPATSEPPKAA